MNTTVVVLIGPHRNISLQVGFSMICYVLGGVGSTTVLSEG